MKKFLALVIVLALMCVMLVSCDNAKTLLSKADAALEKEPYAMTMKINFECDNPELNRIFSLMNIEVPTTVDGKNMAMDMSMDTMGYTSDIKVIVADMVMYYNINMLGQNIKMKSSINETQYQEFMEKNNTEMMINPGDFAELTVEKKDGKKYIACGEISDEGVKELNDMMKKSLADINGKATISDITYGVTLNKGKYESMDMACVYSVTVGGETSNVTLKLNAKFSYDNIAKITAPADSDQYEEVSFSDLMD